MTNGGIIYREEDAHHQIAVTCAVADKARCPVPTEEKDRGSDDVPRYLNKDLRSNKSCPAVHLAGLLSDFID